MSVAKDHQHTAQEIIFLMLARLFGNVVSSNPPTTKVDLRLLYDEESDGDDEAYPSHELLTYASHFGIDLTIPSRKLHYLST